MGFLKKFGKFLGWVFVTYFLFFVIIYFGTVLYFAYSPPVSEFSGLWLVFFFGPFFAVLDFFDNFISSDLSFIIPVALWFILAVLVAVLVLKVKIKIIVVSMLIIILYVFSVYILEKMSSDIVVKTNEGAFSLGREAAKDNDLELCSDKIPSDKVSLIESCLTAAAIYSGDDSFCRRTREFQYCSDEVKLADNFIYLKCGDGVNREDCLNEHCLSMSGEYMFSVDFCMLRNARETGDKIWCEEIAGETNQDDREACFNELEGKEEHYMIDEEGNVVKTN